MRTCAHCGDRMPVARRAQAKTCSTRCRVAMHRSARRETGEAIPLELRRRDRWVRRSAKKVPLTAAGAGAASSTDHTTWSSYDQARRSQVGVGLGFVLNGDGIVCVDLDHCVTAGRVAGWAQAILDMCPTTYVEVSPSGTGLHIWGRGQVERGRRIRRGDVAIEVYGSGRYIAIGTRHGQAPAVLGDLSAVIDRL